MRFAKTKREVDFLEGMKWLAPLLACDSLTLQMRGRRRRMSGVTAPFEVTPLPHPHCPLFARTKATCWQGVKTCTCLGDVAFVFCFFAMFGPLFRKNRMPKPLNAQNTASFPAPNDER